MRNGITLHMNIDLLVSQKGEAGLLCSENLVKKVLSAILDLESGELSLEFVDMDHMELNIPIEESFYEYLDAKPFIHIGSVKDGKVGQAYQTPLHFLNDPYRMQLLKYATLPDKPLVTFHYFIRNCVLGQPAHRGDMGDEDTIGCILGEVAPASLEFAPQLAKRVGFEMQNIPLPEFNAPGLGLGGGRSKPQSSGYYNQIQENRSSPDEDQEND
ncbi:MAG: hypothetical protein ACLFP8_06085 [Alphaproteobacteria bacterium]